MQYYDTGRLSLLPLLPPFSSSTSSGDGWERTPLSAYRHCAVVTSARGRILVFAQGWGSSHGPRSSGFA